VLGRRRIPSGFSGEPEEENLEDLVVDGRISNKVDFIEMSWEDTELM
jgi:hypothetical protein